MCLQGFIVAFTLIGVAPASPSSPTSSDLSNGAPRSGTLCESVLLASVEVDGSGLGEGADVVTERVRHRVESVLRQWDVRPARLPDDPVIALGLIRLPEDTGYRVTYRVRRGAEELRDFNGTAECRLCTESEFVDQIEPVIDAIVPRLIAKTEAMAGSAAPASAPSSSPSSSASAPAPRSVPRELELRLQQARALGVGLLGSGAVLFGVGGGLALGSVWMQDLFVSDRDETLFPLRATSAALATVGTAALISGIVLLVRSKRRAKRPPNLALLAPKAARSPRKRDTCQSSHVLSDPSRPTFVSRDPAHRCGNVE